MLYLTETRHGIVQKAIHIQHSENAADVSLIYGV